MMNADFPVSWLPLADSIVKATLVLAAAAVSTHLLRCAPAALRHLIWTLALVSALLMPVLSVALPKLKLPILSLTQASAPTAIVPDQESASGPSVEPRRTPERRRTAPADIPGMPSTEERASRPLLAGIAAISWTRAILFAWAAGALLIVGRLALGILAVRWMARGGQRVLEAPWMKMAIALASQVGVSSNITFLRTTRGSMPMACGLLHPAVIMPAEADEWPPERVRVVLLHELAHVKRRDCLTHALAQLACAVHWFNPLVWIAARQVRTERERACDDLVLAAGTEAPDYADQLLEIARAMRGDRPALLAGAGLAMAHRSQLEGRLMAILDPRVPHARLTRLRAAAASAACCLAVVPLAAVQPWEDPGQQSTTPLTMASTPQPVPTPAPQPSLPVVSTRAAARDSAHDPQPQAHGAVQEGVRVDIGGALAALAGIDAHSDVRAAIAPGGELHEDEQENQSNVTKEEQGGASRGKADPRMVAALTAALKDSDKEVRETAMHALVQLRDPAIFAPLVEALKDASPDVREQAVFGLGQLRDRRAVAPLTAALKDVHAEVREQAAFALGQLRDPSAVEGLTLAMRDTNGEVREQAVFALGQLRDRKAVEPLVSALKDADADVREQAAFALGQIRDRAAVEALVVALKDDAPKVREQVAFALGQLRDSRGIEGLTNALKDPHASVRQQAAFALGQLAR